MAAVGEPGQVESSIGRVVRSRVAAAVALVVVATGVTTLVVHHHQGDPRLHAVDPGTLVPGVPVQLSESGCGAGWNGGHAGPQRFALHNQGIAGMEAQLQQVATGKVVLDVENLGPNVTRAAQVSLGAGSYRFVCIAEESAAMSGTTVAVTGRYDGPVTPGVLPATMGDLQGAANAYQHWVQTRLPVLEHGVAALAADLGRGDLAAARTDWLTAHQVYETLGAAYGGFGAYDAAINALPATDVAPADDPHLQGFRKIEALLWTGAPAGRIKPYAARLVAAVRALRVAFPRQQLVTAIDMSLRGHEILENTLQFELTGRADAGSHTTFATVAANIVGTQRVLEVLRPLLLERTQDLDAIEADLTHLLIRVRGYRRGHGWTPLDSLSRLERERLDAAMSAVVEKLSAVAIVLDPRGRLP